MERLQGCDETMIDAGEAIIIQSPTAGDMGRRIDHIPIALLSCSQATVPILY